MKCVDATESIAARQSPRLPLAQHPAEVSRELSFDDAIMDRRAALILRPVRLLSLTLGHERRERVGVGALPKAIDEAGKLARFGHILGVAVQGRLSEIFKQHVYMTLMTAT